MNSESTVRCAAGLSGHLDTEKAAEQVCAQCEEGLAGERPDLVIVAASPQHGTIDEVGSRVRERLNPGTLVGVAASAVLGGEVELEEVPGVTAMAMRLPGVTVTPFRTADLPTLGEGPNGEALTALRQTIGVEGADAASPARGVLLFADPYTEPTGALLGSLTAGLEGEGPDERGCPIIGGMASAGRSPGANTLMLNDSVIQGGGVGVTLSGPVRLDVLVSQGCRPIGPPLVVTDCRKQLIKGLAGRPAFEVLAEILHELVEREDEEELRTRGVFVGCAVSEYRERFGRGDFLIRNIVGMDKTNEAIAVAELLRVGQTVQFHLRDASTATEDLALLLDGQRLHGPPSGVLLFTDDGRGRKLFDADHHDARAISRAFDASPAEAGLPGQRIASAGHVPLAGFFAAGEIGPVGGRAFVHGQTACAVLIRPPE